MNIKYHLLFFSLLCLFSCKDDEVSPSSEVEDCVLNETDSAVLDELNAQYAYPFEGAAPELEDEQLTPLIDYLSTAKLVGLGEATHGTAEFYEMKEQIFRQLVTKKGFKAIIFEIPWGNAMVVNDFVTKGLGEVGSAIDQTYYWTYDTEEVRGLANWMYEYNQNLSTEEQILFVGCDPQGGDFTEERRIIRAYLEKVSPDSTNTIMSNYDDLPWSDLGTYSSASPKVHQANIIGTANVYDYLEANREEFIALSSFLEYEITLMAAHVIQNRERIYRVNDFGDGRDALMAIYAEWWQRILDAQVAIWAHNFHVMDGTHFFNSQWMGTHLKERHNNDYINVAFSFGQGSFNAFLADKDTEFAEGVRAQSLAAPPCNTTNHLLTQVEGDQHYLIFKELTGEARNYFHSEESFLQLGAGFNANYPDNYTRRMRLAKLFDVLIHFDETRASKLR